MVDRQRDIAVFKEGNHIIHILKRRSSEGDDAWLSGRGNLLQQHPVVGIRAGDLDDRKVELNAPVHRFLVERRGHRNTPVLDDCLDHLGIV